jgi:hypothetical protein
LLISGKEREGVAGQIVRMVRTISKVAVGFVCLVSVAGCASQPGKDDPVADTADGIGSALHQPLDDFNIDAKEIPDTLVRARRAAYAVPQPDTCEGIAAEVSALDRVLGPDFDVAPAPGAADLKLRGDVVNGFARSAATGWIPFRGAVRWVTGAERHDRDVAEAVLSGAVRRGYLKGLGAQRGCARPAASGASAPPERTRP